MASASAVGVGVGVGVATTWSPALASRDRDVDPRAGRQLAAGGAERDAQRGACRWLTMTEPPSESVYRLGVPDVADLAPLDRQAGDAARVDDAGGGRGRGAAGEPWR